MGRLQLDQVVMVDVGGEVPEMSGIVVDIAARSVSVQFPDLTAWPGPVLEGVGVTLRFADAQGRHTARATVASLGKTPPLVASLAQPAEVHTVQQRQYFRLAASLAVTLTVTAARPGLGPRDADATTQDISAGGARVLTRLALAPGDRLMVSVRMPSARGGAPVEVPARVIRVRPVSIRGRDLCSAALEFLPHERVRDRLVRMMFDLQLNSHLR